MTEKKIHWFKVAEDAALLPWQDNNMCQIEADGKKITMARFGGQFHAFAQKCPHASGIMADGYIDAQGQVVCPVHRYRFNMQNGRNTSGEGYYLKTYLAEERPDGIYIGVEQKGWWF
jgi:3-phenylpropionate/trans-cinnamate dioxygenase ferredoxin subunit